MRVKRHRRLRKLVPDPELFRRRAAGETLRTLAPDYGVSHTALGRFFARPEAREQLKQAEQQLRAEQRAEATGRAAERSFAREVRRKAKAQIAVERDQARHSRAVRARVTAHRRPASSYAAWLDEQDAREQLSRADLHSWNDTTAARVVTAGGGIEAVLEATDLRTRANLLNLIDPTILKQALANDDTAAGEPSRDRLRRLAPDQALLQRRAAGETLRALARDYQVAHTTLARYFHRPGVARQLRTTRRTARVNRKQRMTPA